LKRLGARNGTRGRRSPGRVRKRALFFQAPGIAAACLLLSLLPPPAVRSQEARGFVDPGGTTVAARFRAPAGTERPPVPGGSFAAYLRSLPLKPDGAPVRLYDGRAKPNHGIYAAVVDLPIGRRDLHQCADALIRLRAEYLFARRRFDDIRFRFTSGFLAEYSRWRRGERIVVRGSDVRWERRGRPGDDPRSFWRYLETVFTYAGTASLARELASVPGGEPEIGDIFIQPGHPGHAVIVVDAAVGPDGGRRVFLLAQSYMPAQEIQVLANPGDPRLSPWYASDFGGTLRTPEWIFKATDRKRFIDE